jgi:uncharacterized protein (DUF433 family)
MTATAWPFVETDERGIAYVSGTTTKVVEIALDQIERHLTPDEIHRAYPYLSLPQIHAALGYYHEHKQQCDDQIEEQRRRSDELLDELEDPALQERLRRMKRGA